jgi:phage terminase small subunit
VKKDGLTPKQQRFVEEYLIDLNATQAAIRAGYSAKTSAWIGPRLVSKGHVSRAIEAAKADRSERVEITQDYVIIGLKEVAERCLQKKPVLEYDPQQRRKVQAVDENGKEIWMFDSTGANRAFELLGKHLGIFINKTELTGSIAGAGLAEIVRSAADEIAADTATGGGSE